MDRDIERYGRLNSHIRDNMDFQSIYQRKSIVLFFFFQSSYAYVPRMDYLYYSYFGQVQDPTPSKGVGFGCTTIPKNIGYGCTARPSSHTPWGHTLLWFWSKYMAEGFALSSQSTGRPNRMVTCGLLGAAETRTQ